MTLPCERMLNALLEKERSARAIPHPVASGCPGSSAWRHPLERLLPPLGARWPAYTHPTARAFEAGGRFFKNTLSQWETNLKWAGKESEQADKRKAMLSYSEHKRKQVLFNLRNEWRRLTLHLIKVWKDHYGCQDSLNLLVSLESILESIPGITALRFFETSVLLNFLKLKKSPQLFFFFPISSLFGLWGY